MTAGGILLTGDGRRQVEQAVVRGGGGPAASGGPAYFYGFTPACTGNGTLDGTLSCQDACPEPGAVSFFVYRGTDPGALARVPGTSVCLGPAERVDVAAVRAAVEQWVQAQLPVGPPEAHVAPAGRTLVNLPTIFSATPQTLQPVSITLGGVGVTVTASPTYYWDFDDGPGVTGTGPGRAYDGTSPRTEPEHYVTHTYRRRGSRTVTLTVGWHPSYVIDGLPGDYTTQPVVRSASVPVDVVEGRAHLIASN